MAPASANDKTLAQKAEKLRALHAGPEILVMVNVWDAASARLVELAGFPAIATSSSGVAHASGFPDGQFISREEMLAAVARIAAVVEVPVSADLEAGYGLGAENATKLANGLLDSGAVGLNLEDGTGDPSHPFKTIEQQTEQIRAIRKAGEGRGVHIVINARSDAYWEGERIFADPLAEAIKRCRAYHEAGADCIFLPGLTDAALIARAVKETDAPMNLLARSGMPSLDELKRLGVRRLSFGAAPSRLAWGFFRHQLQEFSRGKNPEALLGGEISFAELNALYSSRKRAAN
jgi:2-methylisocitrate lyase-like PEP mutase family enzyme